MRSGASNDIFADIINVLLFDGEQNSERRMQQLWNAMRDDNRTEDFLAAINDSEFLHQLYDEYGINASVNADSGQVD